MKSWPILKRRSHSGNYLTSCGYNIVFKGENVNHDSSCDNNNNYYTYKDVFSPKIIGMKLYYCKINFFVKKYILTMHVVLVWFFWWVFQFFVLFLSCVWNVNFPMIIVVYICVCFKVWCSCVFDVVERIAVFNSQAYSTRCICILKGEGSKLTSLNSVPIRF